jgi:outer membrane protein
VKTFKNVTTGLILSTFFCLTAFSTIFSQSKIGYVDSQKILGSLKETQTVQSTLQTEQENMYKKLKYMQDSLQESQDDFVKNIKDNQMIKEGAKKAIQKGLEDLAYQLQTSQQKFQEDLQKLYQELMQPVFDKVKKAVDNVRKTEGMDFVLDGSTQIILAADTKYELTQKVLDELIKMGEQKDTGKKEVKDKK